MQMCVPHASVVACQNIHTGSICVSKFTHGPYFPWWISHCLFLVSFCRVGVGNHIFSNLIRFHLLWEGLVHTVTHTKTLLISHIYKQHTTTPPKTSHPAAWWQLSGSRQLCGGGQLGGGCRSTAARWRGGALAAAKTWLGLGLGHILFSTCLPF